MMYYTDDPVRDFGRYDAKLAEQLNRLPVCSECGEHIQDVFCYEINDELICEDCMKRNHRKHVDDYID